MNTLIKSAGKVVATVSASHNVTVTEKMITIDLFNTTTKTKTKRRGRPTGSTKKTTKSKTK